MRRCTGAQEKIVILAQGVIVNTWGDIGILIGTSKRQKKCFSAAANFGMHVISGLRQLAVTRFCHG